MSIGCEVTLDMVQGECIGCEVNEFPEFLNGEERENAQHIQKSTLLLDEGVAERLKINTTSASSKQLEHQFSQLKQEILNSDRSMETLFSLIQELTNAAEKYFALKRLFWKSDELLLFILHTLQLYLPKSTADLLTEAGRHERADELELAILLIETIGLMLHDTEIVPNRLVILRLNRGKIMTDVVTILTCLPEIPQRWRPPRLKAQSLIQTDADGWQSSGDAEVSKLVQELTNASTAVLYELILITQQATWGGEEGQFLNLGWLMQFLNSRKAVTFNFLERLLTQAMKLLLPSKDATLSPAQAVLLFQQFSVLRTLLQHSSIISVHIRSSYYEEFRYYVQSPHIVNKLPAAFPITRNTFQLIEEVLKHVLQSKVSIN
ncbi:hypothetical protein BSL78_11373 [Apostichopus japonicus]|uniref:Uncharacterized protein n=1 Tax=Stichopus japonicus TaxID=307972 RepID=A0A2G8KUU3_STIJA|nr:hypothetical protein BSL78_11373 [Apostichopus japonicus]